MLVAVIPTAIVKNPIQKLKNLERNFCAIKKIPLTVKIEQTAPAPYSVESFAPNILYSKALI